VSADLFDKPFPRSGLTEDTKAGPEATKRKEPTREVTATVADSTPHKESADCMFFCTDLIINTRQHLLSSSSGDITLTVTIATFHEN